MQREHFDVASRADEIAAAIPKCVYLTTKYGDKVNTMAIGWGTLGTIWARPVFVAYVRVSRYTRELLDKNPEFTVNIPVGKIDPRISKVCGSMSGRDVDKVEEAGLTPVDGEKVSVPAIAEMPITLECRVLLRQKQDDSLLPEDIKARFYPDSGDGMDEHITYIGEIVGAYELK